MFSQCWSSRAVGRISMNGPCRCALCAQVCAARKRISISGLSVGRTIEDAPADRATSTCCLGLVGRRMFQQVSGEWEWQFVGRCPKRESLLPCLCAPTELVETSGQAQMVTSRNHDVPDVLGAETQIEYGRPRAKVKVRRQV